MATEMLEFPHGVFGIALNLEESSVGAVLLGETSEIREGDTVSRTGKIISVPVGRRHAGARRQRPGPADRRQGADLDRPDVAHRATSRPASSTGSRSRSHCRRVSRPSTRWSPSAAASASSSSATARRARRPWPSTPSSTRRGSTSSASTTRSGRSSRRSRRWSGRSEENGAMDYTIVVAAAASDPAPQLYISPYSACAIGEYFRDSGRHALCIYDDLSKHAQAYREISLLLRRPPGREAYPGDVFYLHSRLLERAAKMKDDLGGGSLTALPVIETQAGDLSAVHPDQRHLDHRRPDLPGERPVPPGHPARHQRRATRSPASAGSAQDPRHAAGGRHAPDRHWRSSASSRPSPSSAATSTRPRRTSSTGAGGSSRSSSSRSISRSRSSARC